MNENGIKGQIDLYENARNRKEIGSYETVVGTKDYDKLGIYSEIFGIIALILAFIWTLGSLICAAISIVQGRKNHKYGSYNWDEATTGIRCSIVAISIFVIGIVLFVLAFIFGS